MLTSLLVALLVSAASVASIKGEGSPTHHAPDARVITSGDGRP